jgi:type II secretory pathway pseudopilin PulG
VKIRSAKGFALIDLLFVCGIIGIIAGIGLPRLMKAKGNATSASAIGSLRVIGSAQVTFAITCGNGFYAPDLTSLAKPPTGMAEGFVKGDLGAANTVIKSGYSITMSATPYAGTPDTCNLLGPGSTGQAFAATADALEASTTRFFGINAGNTIWEDVTSLTATMPEFGDPPSGAPIK